MRFSKSEQEQLLKIARGTVNAVSQGDPLPDLPEGLPPALLAEDGSGVFVTLHKNGYLRGCIGLMESNLCLVDTVRRMAKAAALDDPRFPEVTFGEVKELIIEISVLSPMEKIEDIKELLIGRDGIMIEGHGRNGVFLPQVAIEAGWDRETFLDECTEHKAGLPRKAWQEKDVAVYKFSAEIFTEKG